MALPINIADLIDGRVIENPRIEYKKGWNPEPIIHTICAFANDIDNWGGGYIIIGVEEENGMPRLPVTGLKKSEIDRINKDLLQKCNLIEPRYVPIVEQTTYGGAEIIVLWAPGGDSRPYKCPVTISSEKTVKSEKAYYIRKASSTIRANQLEEKELILLTENVPFDDRANWSAQIEDLKSSLISEFLYAVGSDLYADSLKRPVSQVAAEMRLIGGPVELRKPLNAGLMFFNERPDTFFGYARIEVIDKPDPTGLGMTEKIFHGPLDRQLRDALSYIQNYIIKEQVTKIPGRAEAERLYNYPYAAIEEALSNAVYHKSYQVPEPITVLSTPDKLEITSLPGPDRTISDEDLKRGKLISRRYRNRRIGDFLKELKLVEGRNTGIPTILRAMQQNGSAAPVFETDLDRSYFTVILPIHERFLTVAVPTPKKQTKSRKSKSDIKSLVLETLRQGGVLSSSELAEKMGYTKVTDTVGNVIRELLKEQKLAYLDPEHPRSRYQKLMLTKKGAAEFSGYEAVAESEEEDQ